MIEALPGFLEAGCRRPPPLVILVSPDANQAADWFKEKNKPRERGSRSGENSCCWRSEADPRPALLSPLQLWSARPLAGSDLRPALLCPAPHLQNVSFISCSSVCLRPALTARKRPCSIMNIVYNNKNKTNSSILKSSLNKYMRLSE